MPVTKTAGAGAPPKAPAAAPAAADEPPPDPLAQAVTDLRTRRLVLLSFKDENDRQLAEMVHRGELLSQQLVDNRAALDALTVR